MEKKSLICLFAFCSFAWVSLCLLVLLVLLVRAKSFHKKNKGIKTALITSFILLLKFILLQAWTFLSQSFSMITVFFNYHNLFQLSQSFSITIIFFNYHDLFQLSRTFLLQFFLSQSFSISLQLIILYL